MKFRVLAGQHIGPDHAQKPAPIMNAAGKQIGEKFPSKTFKTGETVETDTDLIRKFGAEKFQLTDSGKHNPKGDFHGSHTVGDPTPDNQLFSQTSFPAGQVATGFQQTTTGPDGKPVSGPLDPDPEVRAKAGVADSDPHTEERAKKATTKGPSDEDLEGMTVAELKEHLEAEEVEVPSGAHKADLIKAAKKARK